MPHKFSLCLEQKRGQFRRSFNSSILPTGVRTSKPFLAEVHRIPTTSGFLTFSGNSLECFSTLGRFPYAHLAAPFLCFKPSPPAVQLQNDSPTDTLVTPLCINLLINAHKKGYHIFTQPFLGLTAYTSCNLSFF